MKFIMIDCGHEEFRDMCDKCEKEIVIENLKKNGGTLNYYNLTYESDFLILCMNENIPIGFCSLVMLDTIGLYVYQIALKKDYQKRGLGVEMIEIAKQLANNLDIKISAHVKMYNIGSKKAFEKCGFEINDEYSNEDELFYECKQLFKQK